MNVIELRNVSKSYSLTSKRPLLLKQLFSPVREQKHVALKNFSINIKKGEVVGVIGENGSGKSTLLKIIAKVTYSDTGEFQVNGRVCSLIELGAGFHPDLTGVENIYLNGILLGFSKKELNEKLNLIIEFADIGEYIDQPLRTYSSGMSLRLGFAIAAFLEPDILLVDEVLAVGDEQFQRKCLERIESLREQGCTIIFVSHNLSLIETFSHKVLWMDAGQLKLLGAPEEVITAYLKFVDKSKKMTGQKSFGTNSDASIFIEDLRLSNFNKEKIQFVTSGQDIMFQIKYVVNKSVTNPVFGIILTDKLGLKIHWSNTRMAKKELGIVHKNGIITYKIRNFPFLAGKYSVTVGIHNFTETKIYDWKSRALEFEVQSSDNSQGGIIKLNSTWRDEK